MRSLRRHSDTADPSAEPGISPRQLLIQGFARIDDEREENAVRERMRSLTPIPAFFLGVHLICAAAVLIAATPDPPLIAALGGVVLLDLLLWAGSRRYPVHQLSPHAAVRCAAAYIACAGLLWGLVVASASPSAAGSPLLIAALSIASFAVPVVFLSFPGLAALGCLSAISAWLLMFRDPASASAILLVGLCLLRLSLVRTAERAVQFRLRLGIDWNAQRASRFIEEFEQAGRGWFWETTSRGELSYVSDQLAADLKTPAAELIGTSFADLIGVSETGKSDASERTLGFHLSAKLPFTDITVRANTSAQIWWSLSGTPSFDEFGRFLGFRGIGTDLTEQRRSEEEINRLAKYDSLTGLPNRMLMRRTLDEMLQNKAVPSRGCALFLIDLDRFKNVNDTLGHPVGDALLKQVAQRLATVISEKGQVGRLGGDEFKAVLPGETDEATLGALASRLIQQVSMPYMIEGHNISIGASVGIALAPPGSCGDSLIRDADLALYSAKAAGRGTFCFFAPEMHSEAQDRQMLENDLRRAIPRGELELYFQPVVDAHTERLAGFEALVRWHHPTRGMISPAIFIPLAEECGLILQVGEWVLRTACAEAVKWPEDVRVAVNLSPVQFIEPNLPNTIISALANSGLPPRRLELEITEGVFLVESESTDDMFAKLKSIGVRLALDDFGTGYSSLGYLKKAPFDKIKIDQSFVRGAATKGSRNAAIVRAIVGLAEGLGMDTTAEGAETHDELALIRELGCSHVQGYIFGRPLPAKEAGELAAQNEAVTADGFQFNRPPRQGLLKIAGLQWNGMQMSVRVRNISTGGALIETERALPVEAQVQLDLPGCGCLGAHVRWADSGRAGLQFEEEFDLRRLVPGKGKGFGAKLPSNAFPDRPGSGEQRAVA